jgi:hypothetical protein
MHIKLINHKSLFYFIFLPLYFLYFIIFLINSYPKISSCFNNGEQSQTQYIGIVTLGEWECGVPQIRMHDPVAIRGFTMILFFIFLISNENFIKKYKVLLSTQTVYTRST